MNRIVRIAACQAGGDRGRTAPPGYPSACLCWPSPVWAAPADRSLSRPPALRLAPPMPVAGGLPAVAWSDNASAISARHYAGGALLAIDQGFMGPNYSISTACATANYAFVSGGWPGHQGRLAWGQGVAGCQPGVLPRRCVPPGAKATADRCESSKQRRCSTYCRRRSCTAGACRRAGA